jgi:hypothetical protein
MTNRKRPPEEYRPDYRWLADQCRQAACNVPTEKERDDLLSRAKTWDFLAKHFLGIVPSRAFPRN